MLRLICYYPINFLNEPQRLQQIESHVTNTCIIIFSHILCVVVFKYSTILVFDRIRYCKKRMNVGLLHRNSSIIVSCGGDNMILLFIYGRFRDRYNVPVTIETTHNDGYSFCMYLNLAVLTVPNYLLL